MGARFLVVALTCASACDDAAKSSPPFSPTPEPLTIWNSTQRPLEEIRVHSGTEYGGVANELVAPLVDDDRVDVEILYDQHVTVIRRNVDGGQRIAFTTASALNITGPGFVLQVFQESFRLHAPDFEDGPPSDGGGDGGDPDGGDGLGGDRVDPGDGVQGGDS